MDDLRTRINELRPRAAAEQRLFEAMGEASAAYQNATAEEKDAAREHYAALLDQFSQMILPNRENES